MSVELVMDRTKPLEEIWDEVRVYYQRCYKTEWKTRPSDDQIYWLYGEMKKFRRTVKTHYFENQNMRDRALRYFGFAPGEDPTKKREPHE